MGQHTPQLASMVRAASGQDLKALLLACFDAAGNKEEVGWVRVRSRGVHVCA